MSGFAAMRNLQVWYARLPMEQVLHEFSAGVDPKQLKLAEADVAKSRTRDSMHAYEKLTHIVDGEPRIINDPPLIIPIASCYRRERVAPKSRPRFEIYSTPIGTRWPAIGAFSSSNSATSTKPARSSELEASAHGIGSHFSWASTIKIPFSCRPRRLNPRCSSGSSARASTPTTASVSSQGSD